MVTTNSYYYDAPSDGRGGRVVRHDVVSADGETRSELLIVDTSEADNGTYHCRAENKAARAVSNFTLHVVSGSGAHGAPKILHLKLEYFVAVAVAVITVLLLVTIAAAAMLLKVCRGRAAAASRKRSDDQTRTAEVLHASEANGEKVQPRPDSKMLSLITLFVFQMILPGSFKTSSKVRPTPSGKMPKHIQMGTGKLIALQEVFTVYISIALYRVRHGGLLGGERDVVFRRGQ